MANGVMSSIIRNTNIIEDKPPELRRKYKKSKYRKKLPKSLQKIMTQKKKTVKKPRVKKYDYYAGYANLTGHPLPHIDHEYDYMEHISKEYKMIK